MIANLDEEPFFERLGPRPSKNTWPRTIGPYGNMYQVFEIMYFEIRQIFTGFRSFLEEESYKIIYR